MKTATTTLKKKVNLPFRYPGSKASMITNLLSILPASIDWQNKNTGIIELFCGSAIFTFNMMQHFDKIFGILNDKDDLLIKLFHIIKTDCDRLLIELENTNIASETLFKLHKERKYNIDETDFNRVISFLYIKLFCTAISERMFHSTFRTDLNTHEFGITNNLIKIKNIEKFLQRCVINNKSFDNFLKSIKKNIEKLSDVLLFIDPPYLNTAPASTNIDYNSFNEEDMQRLLDYLDLHCKVPFIFCHFPHDLIENWANKNGHTINKFSKNTNTTVLVSTQRKEKEEWFITNYNTFYTHE